MTTPLRRRIRHARRWTGYGVLVLLIGLALLVGVIQIGMGAFKLGVIVNFISHPVIIGFINAAAIIIALSQLNKLLGIPLGRSDSFLYDIWVMLRQIGDTHLPTLAMGLLAFAIMWGMKKFTPENIAATMFETLGIPRGAEWHDTDGRPFQLYCGRPIRELYS